MKVKNTKAKKKSRSKRATSKTTSPRIFSGDYSRDMWTAINSLDASSTGEQVRNVLYLIGCRLQELESRLDKTPAMQPPEKPDLDIVAPDFDIVTESFDPSKLPRQRAARLRRP